MLTSPLNMPPTVPMTILVVDDSLSVRKALEKILMARAGVTSATSAEHALDVLAAPTLAGRPFLPHLIIADVIMPGQSGLDLCRRLRRTPAHAHIPVILISGVVDEATRQEAAAAGATALVRKPFTAEELLPVVEAALAGQPQTSPVAGTPGPQGQDADTAATPTASPNLTGPTAAGAPAAAVSAHAALLGELGGRPGVSAALSCGRGGEVLGVAGQFRLPPADLARYARYYSATADVLGGRLGVGDQRSLVLEYAGGLLLLAPLDAGELLVCLLHDASSVSMVRFLLRQRLGQPATHF